MRQLNTLVERLLRLVAGSLFAAFIVTVLYQVFARDYLKISVSWTDEVAMGLFIWSVFLGAAVAVRRRNHYVVDILPSRFAVAQRALRLFGSVACLPVIYVLIKHGNILVDMGWSRRSVALHIPMAYMFAALPVAGLAMLLFSLEVIWNDIRLLRGIPKADNPHEAVDV